MRASGCDAPEYALRRLGVHVMAPHRLDLHLQPREIKLAQCPADRRRAGSDQHRMQQLLRFMRGVFGGVGRAMEITAQQAVTLLVVSWVVVRCSWIVVKGEEQWTFQTWPALSFVSLENLP